MLSTRCLLMRHSLILMMLSLTTFTLTWMESSIPVATLKTSETLTHKDELFACMITVCERERMSSVWCIKPPILHVASLYMHVYTVYSQGLIYCRIENSKFARRGTCQPGGAASHSSVLHISKFVSSQTRNPGRGRLGLGVWKLLIYLPSK